MSVTIEAVFFNDLNCNRKKELLFAIMFPFLTFIALGIDSVFFKEMYFDGRLLTNVLAILYFLFFFWFSNSQLRKLMFVMVLLSYIGELIFCILLKMYHYRTNDIPLYVPFGHAIVYASGYVYANTKWAADNDVLLRKYFAIVFALLFLAVGGFLNDQFSLIFGVLFFLLLMKKRWNNMYYFIAVCVIFIELTGTYFQCWKWTQNTFGLIPTINPPMGAVFFYAGGDIILMKIVTFWDSSKRLSLSLNTKV